MAPSSAEETCPDSAAAVSACAPFPAGPNRTPARQRTGSQRIFGRMVISMNRRRIIAGFGGAWKRGGAPSALTRERAFVPAPQRQVRDQRQREEDHDAGDRQEEQGGEQPRNVE